MHDTRLASPAMALLLFAACSSSETESPFAILDCGGAGEDEDKCDAVPCSYENKQSSDADGCIEDFINCYVDKCPSGSDVADADEEDLDECREEMNACSGSGDADSDADSDADKDNPFADLDCADDDESPCDFAICELEGDFEEMMSDCDSEGDDYCDGVVQCYEDYVDCATDVCPPGSDGEDVNSDDMLACSVEELSCTNGLEEE